MPEQVPRRLDHRHLHAEADPEEGHLPLAREAHGLDLAGRAALAEAAGHEDAVHAVEPADTSSLLLEDLAVHPVQLDRMLCAMPPWASASFSDL
jgi:hypothetical protein